VHSKKRGTLSIGVSFGSGIEGFDTLAWEQGRGIEAKDGQCGSAVARVFLTDSLSCMPVQTNLIQSERAGGTGTR